MKRWGGAERSAAADELLAHVAPLRHAVADHPIYASLNSVAATRTFMEHHVFAVWDFMSLLSGLQVALTNTTVPWRPIGLPATRRFVHELVLAEDSDEHPQTGGFTSHFELYLEAMCAAGADTNAIDRFVQHVAAGAAVPAALVDAAAPPAARTFVCSTWELVTAGDAPTLVGAFALGRETLIPSMFEALLGVSSHQPSLALLCRYLERHVELDGDDHAPLALRLLDDVCGDDRRRWANAASGATTAVRARAALWDATLMTIRGAADPMATARSAPMHELERWP